MSPSAQGHLAMLVFSGLVAGSFSLGVRTANQIDPSVVTAVRFSLAAVMVGTVAWASGGLTRKATEAPWRYPILGAVFAAYFVLMFEGLKTAPPVSAAAVFTLTPVLSAIAGWLVMRQVTTPRMALALAVGGAGAVWVIFRADIQAILAFGVGRGEAIYFLGCVAHAVYVPMVRLLNWGESALTFTFGTLVAGALVLVVWAWGAIVATDWAALPGLVWVMLAYVAVMSTAVTFVLVQFASLRLPAAKVMAYSYLTPSWVIGWELGFGATLPPPLVLAGVGLTVVALLLLLRD
jgi:drug/metabolite transporter (DMT)-like permease